METNRTDILVNPDYINSINTSKKEADKMSSSALQLRLKSGNEIPVIGIGTFRMKGEECRQAVETALELGYTHIDTAEMYENESAIGKAIQEFDRSDLFITSKVWRTNLEYGKVLDSCEASLNRLNTPYLDLYLIHWPSRAGSIREAIQAMEKLYDEGQVRSIGVSNFSIPLVEETLKMAEKPICVNQVEFHPWLYQNELLEFCQKRDITLMAYTPLARTQVFEDEVIRDLAKKYGKTPAQITLRWEIQKGVVAIPRSSSRNHLKENLQIFDWELDLKDERKIDAISKTKRIVSLGDITTAAKFSLKEFFS